jgi:hypothetical protein
MSASPWFVKSTRLEASEIQKETRNISPSVSEAQALKVVAERRKVN